MGYLYMTGAAGFLAWAYFFDKIGFWVLAISAILLWTGFLMVRDKDQDLCTPLVMVGSLGGFVYFIYFNEDLYYAGACAVLLVLALALVNRRILAGHLVLEKLKEQSPFDIRRQKHKAVCDFIASRQKHSEHSGRPPAITEKQVLDYVSGLIKAGTAGSYFLKGGVCSDIITHDPVFKVSWAVSGANRLNQKLLMRDAARAVEDYWEDCMNCFIRGELTPRMRSEMAEEACRSVYRRNVYIELEPGEKEVREYLKKELGARWNGRLWVVDKHRIRPKHAPVVSRLKMFRDGDKERELASEEKTALLR